ncbi:MAG: M20/M25/M40 family metallo-hydrolase [Prolixibacteraceae bacterium]|nr:M20/M25/M40 family metallo-hydrolase [Prolixibacteraceae bacterium]
MKRLFSILILLLSFSLYGQDEIAKGLEAITESAVRGQLEFLASDWMEGRGYGTRGAYMAADYIASMFQVYGVEPFGDMVTEYPNRRERMQGMMPRNYKSYFQNFPVLEYSPGEEQKLAVITGQGESESAVNFTFKTDFNVQTATVGKSAKAPLVFAGYGFKNNEKGYDDLAGVDVKGKIAVIMTGFPGHKDTTSLAWKQFVPKDREERNNIERNKRDHLLNSGAVAIIIYSSGQDPALSWAHNRVYPFKGDHYEADEPLSSYYDSRATLPGDTLQSDVPVFIVTSRLINKIMEGSGLSPDEFEKRVAEKARPLSMEIDGKSASFKTTVNSGIVKVRNVLGFIEGENKDEYIVIGGHYDHLGKWNGWIWNGADDNASGTVGVMTIAKAFKATGKKPEKSVIFAAWTAEEKGLWGSRYFVNDAMDKGMNIALYLNYDMIARNTEDDSKKNQASMVYTQSKAGIEKLTKKNVRKFDIDLDITYKPSEKPSGGSDHTPFAQQDIPVFYFMAAMHPDYHSPSDELNKINWDKMINIIKTGFLNTWEVANSDEYLE